MMGPGGRFAWPNLFAKLGLRARDGGESCATTFFRLVMVTLSPSASQLSIRGKAVRNCRTVAVFIYVNHNGFTAKGQGAGARARLSQGQGMPKMRRCVSFVVPRFDGG